jgi:hypothetical protein
MRSWSSKLLLAGLLAFVISVWLGVGYLSWNEWWNGSDEAMARNGQYGDTFGSLNSLFAGLAFVGLVYTLTLQQQQIRDAGHASGTAQFFELTRYLDEHRDDRRNVYSLAESKGPCMSWTPDEQQIAEKVCAGFNLAGVLAREDDKLKKLVVDAWAYSASKCYSILRDLVEDRRKFRDPGYAESFEWLVAQITHRTNRKEEKQTPIYWRRG